MQAASLALLHITAGADPAQPTARALQSWPCHPSSALLSEKWTYRLLSFLPGLNNTTAKALADSRMQLLRYAPG